MAIDRCAARADGAEEGRRAGGPAGAEVKQHTDQQRGTAARRGHMDIQSVQGNTTMGHLYHKGGTLTTRSYTTSQQSLHKSQHNGGGGVKQMVHMHTHNRVTQPYSWSHYHNQFTP